MTPEQERVEREAFREWLGSAMCFYTGSTVFMESAWLARAQLQPSTSKSDEGAFESWVIDQRWFQPDPETDMIARDSWLAACAHKEAQRAGGDEVIKDLAAQLQAIYQLHPWSSIEHYLTKHATRIAAARGEK